MVWVYDILSEFVYFFERQQQEKMKLAGREGEEGGAPSSRAVSASSSTWSLAQVLRMLHALVKKAGLAVPGAPPVQGDTRDFRSVSGYMASLCLVRMYGKLADYGSALEAARPLGLGNPDAPYVRVHSAHATVVFYVGFSLIQSRRLEEALRLLSRSLCILQQQCRVFDDANSFLSDFLRKQASKMLNLAAVTASVCPSIALDEIVAREIKRRHIEISEALDAVSSVPWKFAADYLAELGSGGMEASASVSKTGSAAVSLEESAHHHPLITEEQQQEVEGEDEDSEESRRRKEFAQWEESIGFACAKLKRVFDDASPSFFAYTPVHAPSSTLKATCEALYNSQLRLFRTEVLSRSAGVGGLQLRSIMRMYTTIGLPKLAAAAGLSLEDARSALTSTKLKAWASSASKEGSAVLQGVGEGGGGGGIYVDPLHFFLDGDVVHVDEARRSENVGAFFVNSIKLVQREVARATGFGTYSSRH